MEVRTSRILAPVAEHQDQPKHFKAIGWPGGLLSLDNQEELYLTCLIGGVGVGFLIKGFGGKKSLFGGVGVGS